MSTLTPQEAAKYCQNIATNSQREMATIAKDTRFNPSHKQQELARIRAEAMAKIEQVRTDFKTDQEQRRAELELKARYNPAPTPEQANQLMYTKAALEAKWRTMSATELHRDFEATIAAKDTIAAKVYRDFSAPVWMEKSGLRRTGEMPADWLRLADSVEALILPPDVSAARAQLAQVDSEGKQFLIDSRTAMISLDAATLGSDQSSIVSVSPVETFIRTGF